MISTLKDANGLDLRGDSLIRHLMQAARTLLIGDLVHATNAHMGSNASLCTCDGAYDDGHIRRFEGNFMSEKNKFCRENSISFQELNATRANGLIIALLGEIFNMFQFGHGHQKIILIHIGMDLLFCFKVDFIQGLDLIFLRQKGFMVLLD